MKIALIIGGSGGIGQAVAKKFTDAGYRVYSTWHQTEPTPAKNINFVKMDVTDINSVNSAIQKINSESKINIVVFTVSAPIYYTRFFELGWPDFEAHLNIQVKGFYNLVTALKPHIVAGENLKIIVLSTAGIFDKVSASRLAHYLAAKHALLGLVKSVFVELQNSNTEIITVSPDMVDTNLIKNMPPKLKEITAAKNPSGRLTSPADIAKIILDIAESDKYKNGDGVELLGGEIVEKYES